jgi:hypothetical protein
VREAGRSLEWENIKMIAKEIRMKLDLAEI